MSRTTFIGGFYLTLTKLANQAKQVVTGTRIISDRIVSFFDPQARPIKKGILAKGTKFGYKTRIDETESSFVTSMRSMKAIRSMTTCWCSPAKRRSAS